MHPPLIESALETFIEATQAPAVQRLAVQDHIVESAKLTARLTVSEANMMLSAAKEILPRPLDLKTASPAAHLTDSQKAELIREVGYDGYKEILAGTRALPLDAE